MISVNKHILGSLSLLILLGNCSQVDDNDFYNSELVFKNSYPIDIAPYSYIDSQTGLQYYITGDTITDTLNNTPVFQWKNDHSDIVTCAIFSAPVSTSNGTLLNAQDIIWQWHTGMEHENITIDDEAYIQVSYNWGFPVSEKKIQYNTQPFNMQSGLYYWAVWSWDKSAREVLYSTALMKFLIE